MKVLVYLGEGIEVYWEEKHSLHCDHQKLDIYTPNGKLYTCERREVCPTSPIQTLILKYRGMGDLDHRISHTSTA
jgi:hypothetical protein